MTPPSRKHLSISTTTVGKVPIAATGCARCGVVSRIVCVLACAACGILYVYNVESEGGGIKIGRSSNHGKRTSNVFDRRCRAVQAAHTVVSVRVVPLHYCDTIAVRVPFTKERLKTSPQNRLHFTLVHRRFAEDSHGTDSDTETFRIRLLFVSSLHSTVYCTMLVSSHHRLSCIPVTK